MKVKIGSESTSFKEDFHTKKHPLKRGVFMVRKAGFNPFYKEALIFLAFSICCIPKLHSLHHNQITCLLYIKKVWM